MPGTERSDAARIGALADPVRARIYRYIVDAGTDVGRDEVAKALRIPRSQATFHLERLAQQGLVDTTFRRLSERGGPGAGRTSKLYRRSRRTVEVSFPPRDYQLAAAALAEAVGGRASRRTKHLAEVAKGIGTAWAAERSTREQLKNLEAILRRHGYEPHWDTANQMRLRNCPFAGLVAEHEEIVCKVLNRHLVEGLIEGLGAKDVTATYTPPPPMCCISLRVN
ncbi:MAG TPA: helix-turn-helix domain-containing protein [Actinomycetota bacterium]|jgi:predicted ArsR family transcriptional regulator